ncbi:peptidase C1A, papain [Seminavis robusta]|uniref:Peptidase C1A, papain n=1 Tax=Seminavis robusta TaxID=568900 RepID=A0A9N8E3J0_9STRA|nr:peptidase C1A, papain [Seminavis robusta]|eukprot:Sro517_g158720.1 peptidase C1A, papain (321) ;mRNA; f:49040-50149
MRPFMTPVEDQARAMSCVANAVVGGYEYIMKRNGVEIDFSRLFVYYNARVKAKEAEAAAAAKVDPCQDAPTDSEDSDDDEEDDAQETVKLTVEDVVRSLQIVDEPFGPDFLAGYDAPQDVQIFSLEEAIVSLCLIGSAVDGYDQVESDAVDSLFPLYGLSVDEWLKKFMALKNSQGFDACRAASVAIILAHKLVQLGEELHLSDEFVSNVFATLLQEKPDTISLALPAPLRLHSRGVAVDQLQQRLVDLGYNVQVKGFFGKPTRRAVRKFQKDKGLKQDSIVGQKRGMLSLLEEAILMRELGWLIPCDFVSPFVRVPACL